MDVNPVNLVNPVNVHRLLIATRNEHKAREFSEILGVGFEVRDLANTSEVPQTEETGRSFEENATLKAVEASQYFPELVIADDSGLEVDALQGAPGIFSARYAGEHATDAENIAKLLLELERYDPPHTARFRCCLALAREGQILRLFNGVVEGVIVDEPRGTAGFGYDPVFQPLGFEQTFAELPAEAKNRMSHRANAIRALQNALLGTSC